LLKENTVEERERQRICYLVCSSKIRELTVKTKEKKITKRNKTFLQTMWMSFDEKRNFLRLIREYSHYNFD